MKLKINPTDRWWVKRPQKIDHLSYSSVQTFNTCGLAWRLAKVDMLELKDKPTPSWSVFGTSYHLGLSSFWKGGSDGFIVAWKKWKDKAIKYGRNESWLDLYRKGLMMTAAVTAILKDKFDPKESKVEVVEDLDLGFVIVRRIVDIATIAHGVPVLMVGQSTKPIPYEGPIRFDVKTAGRAYDTESIIRSQQLMTYAIPSRGQTEKRLSAYLVATKSESPKVQILGAQYGKEQIKGQINRIRDVTNSIHRGEFTQNPGDQCVQCEFRSLCYSLPGWQEKYQLRRDRPRTDDAVNSSNKYD